MDQVRWIPELPLRLLWVPVGNEKRPQNRWQDVGEADRLDNGEPAPEGEQDRLHHRVGLVARGQTGDVPSIPQEGFEVP